MLDHKATEEILNHEWNKKNLPFDIYNITTIGEQSKILGFHGGDYEECRILGCYDVWLLYDMMFRRNVAAPSSG
jgi:hypothetical protein